MEIRSLYKTYYSAISSITKLTDSIFKTFKCHRTRKNALKQNPVSSTSSDP